jgi:hypothetical protein
MGQGYVRFAVDNPEHFNIMFTGELLNKQDPDYLRASESVYGPFIEVIIRAGKEGRLAAEPLLVGSAASATRLFVDRMMREG